MTAPVLGLGVGLRRAAGPGRRRRRRTRRRDRPRVILGRSILPLARRAGSWRSPIFQSVRSRLNGGVAMGVDGQDALVELPGLGLDGRGRLRSAAGSQEECGGRDGEEDGNEGCGTATAHGLSFTARNVGRHKTGIIAETGRSIVAQGHDGIDTGRPAGRIEARGQADQEREGDGPQEDRGREGEVTDIRHPLSGRVEVDEAVDDQARRPTEEAAGGAAEEADGPRLEEEDAADVAVAGPDGLHDPDLPGALEDGHDHGVDDAQGGDDDGDHADGGQDHVHDHEAPHDLVELIGQGEGRKAHFADPGLDRLQVARRADLDADAEAQAALGQAEQVPDARERQALDARGRARREQDVVLAHARPVAELGELHDADDGELMGVPAQGGRRPGQDGGRAGRDEPADVEEDRGHAERPAHRGRRVLGPEPAQEGPADDHARFVVGGVGPPHLTGTALERATAAGTTWTRRNSSSPSSPTRAGKLTSG
ncbi:MAG: hypothetical protein MZV64_18300 [Ignavibacteriales bacterium]|nr:hypothetical protein [Ignavibacteriales bacterium]